MSSQPTRPARSRSPAPDFFIAGAPKCGTTAMAEYLAAHPDIYMARKELHFFGADLEFGPSFYRRDREAYLAEFDGWTGQRRLGEASVWYLFSKTAAAEIKAFNPEASIIVLLREPVEMLYSLYYQFRFDGNEHLPTFEAALAAEPDRRAKRRIPRQAHLAQGLLYHDVARYTDQLRRYFDVFGRERVHVILYDDFAADAGAAYRQTLEFLGVDPDCPPPAFDEVNGSKTVRSPLLHSILTEPLLRSAAITLARKLPRPVGDTFRYVQGRLSQLNASPRKRPPLSPELRAQLQKEFAPEVERLSALLERDLTHWSRPSAQTPPTRRESPARRDPPGTSRVGSETRARAQEPLRLGASR